MGITPNCSVPNLCVPGLKDDQLRIAVVPFSFRSEVWTCILAPCSLYFIWVFPHLWKEGCYALPLATLAVPLAALDKRWSKNSDATCESPHFDMFRVFRKIRETSFFSVNRCEQYHLLKKSYCEQNFYFFGRTVLVLLGSQQVFVMATGFLLATCCSDPGIIPRREVVLATKTAKQLQEQLGYASWVAVLVIFAEHFEHEFCFFLILLFISYIVLWKH